MLEDAWKARATVSLMTEKMLLVDNLAKLFFWFSWNLPPCSVEHKSWYADATHIQLLYSSAYDKVFNRLGPTHPDLQASSGMVLSLCASEQHCVTNENSLQTY